jgi:hypothetical protein
MCGKIFQRKIWLKTLDPADLRLRMPHSLKYIINEIKFLSYIIRYHNLIIRVYFKLIFHNFEQRSLSNFDEVTSDGPSENIPALLVVSYY